jgi:hypothetical protein
MVYTEPTTERRFSRIRRLSMGQRIGLVAGAFALAFGVYLFFNFV